MIALGIAIVLFSYFINRERGYGLKFNFKLNNIQLLLVATLVVALFEIVFNIPISKTIRSFSASTKIINNPFQSFAFAFGAVLVGPIIEELIFRGIILKGFLGRYTPIKAIVFSAIMFGLVHAQLILIPQATLIGLFLGWIYYKTNSVGTTIILHSTANLFSLLAGYLYYKIGSATITAVSDIYGNFTIPILITGLIVFIVLFRYLLKKW